MAVNSTFDGPDLSDGASSFAGSDLSDDFSVDDAVEELGDGVKGLQLSQLVGRGAFGAVYKVSWRGRPAALKVCTRLQLRCSLQGCSSRAASNLPLP